jgi:hypothetical protein
MTEEAATIKTESEKTMPGETEKETKMKMADRQINHRFNLKMRLPLTLQQFTASRAPARAPHGWSAGNEPRAGQGDKGQKNTRASP